MAQGPFIPRRWQIGKPGVTPPAAPTAPAVTPLPNTTTPAPGGATQATGPAAPSGLQALTPPAPALRTGPTGGQAPTTAFLLTPDFPALDAWQPNRSVLVEYVPGFAVATVTFTGTEYRVDTPTGFQGHLRINNGEPVTSATLHEGDTVVSYPKGVDRPFAFTWGVAAPAVATIAAPPTAEAAPAPNATTQGTLPPPPPPDPLDTLRALLQPKHAAAADAILLPSDLLFRTETPRPIGPYVRAAMLVDGQQGTIATPYGFLTSWRGPANTPSNRTAVGYAVALPTELNHPPVEVFVLTHGTSAAAASTVVEDVLLEVQEYTGASFVSSRGNAADEAQHIRGLVKQGVDNAHAEIPTVVNDPNPGASYQIVIKQGENFSFLWEGCVVGFTIEPNRSVLGRVYPARGSERDGLMIFTPPQGADGVNWDSESEWQTHIARVTDTPFGRNGNPQRTSESWLTNGGWFGSANRFVAGDNGGLGNIRNAVPGIPTAHHIDGARTAIEKLFEELYRSMTKNNEILIRHRESGHVLAKRVAVRGNPAMVLCRNPLMGEEHAAKKALVAAGFPKGNPSYFEGVNRWRTLMAHAVLQQHRPTDPDRDLWIRQLVGLAT